MKYTIEEVKRAAPRFWSKVDMRGEDECWPWTGYRNDKGYGTLWFVDRKIIATRMSMLIHEVEQAGPMVCHTCDNPPCVNPKHLFWGTMKENMHDSIKKGRFVFPVPIRKTHCKRGHPLIEGNLRKTTPRGICKRCGDLWNMARFDPKLKASLRDGTFLDHEWIARKTLAEIEGVTK